MKALAPPFVNVLALTLLGAVGGTHLGPKTVSADRFEYSNPVADSWKQQTLLNIGPQLQSL